MRKARNGKKIIQLDYLTGEEIAVHESMQQAADVNGIERSALYAALANRGGYIEKLRLRFKFADYTIVKQRRIRQLDIDTDEAIDLYRSIREAAKDNFITQELLKDALENTEGIIVEKQLKFEYAD